MLEALVVGVLASVVGLLLGLGLAKVLNALLISAGIDLPSSGTVFAQRTVVVALLVGVLITLLASIRPAVRATRVPPIAAVREGAMVPPSRLARFAIAVPLALTALAVAILVFGVFAGGLAIETRLLSSGIGAILLFIGVALLAPRLVRPLASVLGWPGVRLGGAGGKLARSNAMRNPSRTASTAAALMIGLALVTFVAILAQGLRSTFVDAVDELFVADYALTAASGFAALSPEIQQAASRTPSVTAISAVRSGEARIGGKDIRLSAVDPGIARTIDICWHRGSDAVPAQLGRVGAFVTRSWAQDEGLSVGSPLGSRRRRAARCDSGSRASGRSPRAGRRSATWRSRTPRSRRGSRSRATTSRSSTCVVA